ncbi:NAD(P)-binding protein [Alphaproteobacteria bacterium]|nr:NAD(P)-binding protein [Alphaproteobacteria bacterium]
MSRKKIAIVGAGVSGLSAAFFLSNKNDVTLFELSQEVGGHAQTKQIQINDQKVNIDLGFVVYNYVNYKNFSKFLRHLNVSSQPTNMSFSFSKNLNNFEYASMLPFGPFAQPSNIFSAEFLIMLKDIIKFYIISKSLIRKGINSSMSLDSFLKEYNFSKSYCFNHLLPMASSIWSLPISNVLQFQAKEFLKFYYEHGLLNFYNRPKWRIISGGSREYIKKFLKFYKGKLNTNERVVGVVRSKNLVKINTIKNNYDFDHVIFATHPRETIKIIKDLDSQETSFLEIFEQKVNQAYLHTDQSLMPLRKIAWSSWNYSDNSKNLDGMPSVTYWVNRLQQIKIDKNIFISLNPQTQPKEEFIIEKFKYNHPVFNVKIVDMLKKLSSIQGINNSWHCGAWTGYGFHEDGFSSGMKVASSLGADIL